MARPVVVRFWTSIVICADTTPSISVTSCSCWTAPSALPVACKTCVAASVSCSVPVSDDWLRAAISDEARISFCQRPWAAAIWSGVIAW